MAKRSKLTNETIMYSINPVRMNRKGEREGGEVMTHHLPWSSDSTQLQRYVAKGFTFERPRVELQPTPGVDIPEGFYHCGKCLSNHKVTDKAGSIGKRHSKYKGG